MLSGSTFVDLVINGQAINANVAPNTEITVPGVAKVVLKKITTNGNGRQSKKITVEMLTVELLAARLGLPLGAKIVVAHAVSGFVRTTTPVLVGGEAYAASANAAIGSSLQSQIGKTALVTLPCEGTNGRTLTNNVESLSVGSVLEIATGQTTAFGGATSNGTTAKTTARVENVRLLGGLITATAITAAIEDTIASGVRTRSAAGSGFAALRVAGIPINVNIAPNSQISIPGVGHVIVNEQKIPPVGQGGRSEVNGLRIVVTRSNVLNLPVGSEILVAHAHVNAKRN